MRVPNVSGVLDAAGQHQPGLGPGKDQFGGDAGIRRNNGVVQFDLAVDVLLGSLSR
jgi:hypothetical protein